MRAKTLTAFSAAALGVALAAVPVRAESPAPRSDAQIQAAVDQGLIDRDIEGVTVAAHGGEVTLTGMVPNGWSRDEAGRIALESRDVKGVANRLTVARGESDGAVARSVARQVRRYVLYSVFDDVGVGVKDGEVTLTGEVTAGYKADDIARIASKVRGVAAVRNEIRTLPASPFDDRLRAAIARRIYTDPMFESYALQVPPPIHIVVENGHVTLTGAVGTEVERVKAGFTAREVFGVMSVDNELKVAA
jgi:hyperosmotically inducible periplasmic protein